MTQPLTEKLSGMTVQQLREDAAAMQNRAEILDREQRGDDYVRPELRQFLTKEEPKKNWTARFRSTQCCHSAAFRSRTSRALSYTWRFATARTKSMPTIAV